MCKRLFLVMLCGVGLTLAAPRPAPAGDNDNVLADELVVKSAGLPVDGAGLMEFFRLRTDGEIAPDRLAALVGQLGGKDPMAREKACAELVAVGPAAVPALRQAAKDADTDAAGLARRCLTALESNSASVSAAVVRLTARRRPDGAAAALLAFLPYAEDESVLAEVKSALTTMAYHDGKADPALLKALDDESPLRRSTAVDVLCENGLAEPRDALRKLLADPKPTVQLRAALALAQVRDANAVATLIDLLGKLPVAQGRNAEEYLSNLAGDQAGKLTLTDDASRAKVRDAWAAWWKSTEGKASLDEFSKRTLTEADREKAEKLIHQLGDDAFDVRQKAQADLKGMGVVVMRMLKTAANDPNDLQVSQSARDVLQEIENDKAAPLSPVAARVVALRKPPGAAEVLLAYLPFCDDEGLLAEVQTALNAVAYTDGKADPALVRALGDKAAVRRGAAAEALCAGPLGDNLAAVRKLLKDDQPSVRLQAALGLAGGPHDRDAVPVLIALVGEQGDQSGPAEDYLMRLAADHGPLNMPVGDGDARGKRRDQWAAWWKDNGERVALVDRYAPSAFQRYLGYTLLIQPGNGQIIELGADNKERVKLDRLTNPVDAQALPGDRYLVTEGQQVQRVTERNVKGEVLWTKQVSGAIPVSAQRLPNGNTFIVCRNQILECTRDGKDVYTIARPMNDVLTAQKLRNNEIVIISSQGTVQRIDKEGKELKSFRMPLQTWMVGNDILANGNVLVATQANKVVEYDPEGKVVWESSAVMNPMAAARSPNGNTLIVSQQWPNQIVEVDKNNKEVAKISLPTYTMRVRRR